jgi:hypothetical protein
LITNYQIEDNLEIHLKEVHLKEICLESHLLIGPFGWLVPDPHMFIPPWYQPHVVHHVLESSTKLPYRKLQYPTYVKGTNTNAHIRVFKKAIKTNGEIV